jgi:DNA-binding HxlR family transcriptional regulator
MPYIQEIDDIIKETIYKNKKNEIHFNGLLEIVKKHHPKTTRRMLSRHLRMMEENKPKIIERDPFRSGGKRNIRLTKNVRWALDLEMSTPKVKSKKEEKSPRHIILKQTKEERNKKAYLLLLSLATIGFTIPEPVNDISKVEAGDFLIRSKPHRISSILPGASIKDFFHEYRDFLNKGRFRDVKFKDTSDIEQYFKKIAEHEPPIIMPINDIGWIKREQLEKKLPWPIEGETRYGIADKLLHEWLNYCIILLGHTEMLLEHIWRYKRNPRREEISWYEFIYGKTRAKRFFLGADLERSELRKGGKNTILSGVYRGFTSSDVLDSGIETIERIKLSPMTHYQRLLEEKYSDIYAKYGIITKPLMDIAYPDFMKDIPLLLSTRSI